MRLLKPIALSLLPLTLLGSSFDDASEHLDLDGTFVAYMNFDGDGEELGEKLNRVYQELLAANPDMPPIPVNFPALFDALGFGSIKAVGASSIEIEGGLHLNRSVALLDGELKGLFGIYGDGSSTFTGANFAPADATTVATGFLDYTALIDSAKDIANQVMGGMGVGFVDNWLAGPAFGTEVTYQELFEALSGKWDIALKQGLTAEMDSEIVAWLSIEGAGSLLSKLRSIEAIYGATFTETNEGLSANLSHLLESTGMGLYFFAPSGSDNLVIYTDPSWTAMSEGPRLSETEDFQQLASRLPEEAMVYNYSSGIDVTPIYEFIESNPQTADYIAIARRAIDELLSDFLEPTVTASYMEGEALLSEQYAGYSTKQIVAMVPVAFIGGVSAVAAMSASEMQDYQTSPEEVAITNNLSLIASAAQQYMLETGADAVTIDDIVGPDKYITEIISFAGESYDDIVITYETYTISVVLPDGRVVFYEF